jgi:hypothetical protein
VQSVQRGYFTVGTDHAPYRVDLSVPDGRAPSVGTRLALDEWKGDVIAIVDPVRGRRHTGSWPSRNVELGIAITFDFFFLLAIGMVVAGWLGARSDRSAKALQDYISEQRARTS